MALYAIGDLHLSFGTDKPMDVFGGGWSNYVEKIKEGFSQLGTEDVCVLCGDTSWGISFEESLPDFKFISELPGKKIILKGNHDYWWDTVSKMRAFFAKNGIENIEILNNNCFFYEGAAICGTRGWVAEDEADVEHNRKIMAREAGRLRASLAAAGDADVKLCFFHYPPRFRSVVCHDIISVMNEFGVKGCWYGHLHSHAHSYATRGEAGGINYELVSADFVGFAPQRVITG
ncbi:MAG: metallophosphoesterase [Oscillospiraceae bacterium]|nr:metallophosphoesterase [Oscillospiraceae bacterium]